MHTFGPIVTTFIAAAIFAIAAMISLSRIWKDRNGFRIAAKACLYVGMLVSLAALIWHASQRENWIPLDDNFDTLLSLAIILAGFVLYVQRRKPLGGLDWFIIPITILLLLGAGVVGIVRPQPYDTRNLWSWIHLASAYAGVAAFAVAGAGGAMYLVAHHRLRNKSLGTEPRLASLERIEQLTLHAATLGFALLTVGVIVGLLQMRLEHRATSSTKLALTAAVWIVFALTLHSPINPSFRGRRTAMLSVVGFVLVIGTVVAALVSTSN